MHRPVTSTSVATNGADAVAGSKTRRGDYELTMLANLSSKEARDLPPAACGPHYYCAPVARVTFDVFAETLSVLRSGDNRVCRVTGRGAGSGADATAPRPSGPG